MKALAGVTNTLGRLYMRTNMAWSLHVRTGLETAFEPKTYIYNEERLNVTKKSCHF